jgi:hypothetical protein
MNTKPVPSLCWALDVVGRMAEQVKGKEAMQCGTLTLLPARVKRVSIWKLRSSSQTLTRHSRLNLDSATKYITYVALAFWLSKRDRNQWNDEYLE